VWRWLYRHHVTSIAQMATLPIALRERLAAETSLYVPPVLAQEEALDGETRKDLLALADGQQIEVVLLRYGARHTACISTQVGCACGCSFCATGQVGFVRDLTAGEIVSQALHLQRELAAEGKTLSNIVVMGMGEPLLNYDRTLAAVRQLIHPRGMGFVERRITLSTVGIVPGIDRLADEGLLVNLAVSLHAATDELRDRLVPVNRRYPLTVLFNALRRYTDRTGQRVMIEWLMIAGVNDMPEQAQALIAKLDGLPTHVNLIQLNPTAGYEDRPSSMAAIDDFAALLDQAGIPRTVRQRRGREIAAGCGQLRGTR
jgi:23S rRNA (adenine2503-C2)-methyltransferase